MAAGQLNRRSEARQSADAPDGGAYDSQGLGCARRDPSTTLGTNGEVSRRTVLGAAAALPLSCHPGLDPGSTWLGPREAERWVPDQVRNDEAWRTLMAAYRAAEGAVEAAGRRCAAVPRQGSGPAWRAEIGAAEDAYGDRLETLYERLRGLLTAPAPDVAALLVKVELAFEHEIQTLAGGDACGAAIVADARGFREGSV